MDRRRFIASASAFLPVMSVRRGIAEFRDPGPSHVSSAAILDQENSTNIPEPGTQDQPQSEYFKRLKRLPYLREHLGWQIALIEHSMYMLIDEDRGEPTVGERVLPWGAPDASVYVERIRRNLTALEKLPALRLSYDFPGVDLESIARDFPDVMSKMQRMHEKGVFDFVNGTYSLPHLHTLSSESNWRQFEYGLEVFQRYFGKKIALYAFQESNLHQQLPQILSLFGYQMMSTSAQFPWMMEIVEGTFELESSHQGTNFISGDEFVQAQALDGTLLPCYIVHSIPGWDPNSNWMIRRALERDFWGPPPVWEYCPDLEEVTEQTQKEWAALFDLVLIEPALRERIKIASPKAKAKVFSYWSYAEGAGAEEYLRANRNAEQMTLLAESLQAMARSAGSSLDRRKELKEIWGRILKYECHDTVWVEAVNLRRKATDVVTDCAAKSTKIALELAQTLVNSSEDSVVIFNPLPSSRRALIELQHTDIPAGDVFQKFEGRCLGFRDLPAGGFKSFSRSGQVTLSQQVAVPRTFSTDHYQITLGAQGLTEQISTREGKPLLNCAKYLGGELRAMIDDEWKDNRTADCAFYSGEVFNALQRSSRLGKIPLRETYFFFRHENLIAVELEFSFDGDTVGHFWLDETKVNVYYPTLGSDIFYDIPFGYLGGRSNRPLYPLNWLYCGGLSYVNRGTAKHWVRDGVIANVLAWGGNSIGNRDELFWDESKYDVRLYGKQKIQYSLIPYEGFDGSRVVRDVTNYTTPVLITKGAGERSFYQVPPHLAVTAVYDKEGTTRARGYKLPSTNKSKLRDFEIFNSAVADLSE
jgi:hypothetical protein